MECITYIIIPCHIYSYFERPSVAINFFFMEGIIYIYIYILPFVFLDKTILPCYIYSYFERPSVASDFFNGSYSINYYNILFILLFKGLFWILNFDVQNTLKFTGL